VANQTLADPFYYLSNFQRVLQWLGERYSDLLDEHEAHFIRLFGGLEQTEQALLVRMIMRKGELFRTSRLQYPEIGCPQRAAQALLAAELVDDRAPLSVAQLFDVLLKNELLSIFKPHLDDPAARKVQWLQVLEALQLAPRPIEQWCPQWGDRILALRVGTLCDRLRLMFFGNLRQGWTEFVLADLGVYRYERVEFDVQSRGLRDRSDIDAALSLHECALALEADAESDAVMTGLLAVRSDNPWLQRRRDTLLFRLAQTCERRKHWAQALQIYRQCAHPQARSRTVRVLELNGELAAALDLAQQALAAPHNAAEVQQLARMLPRLQRGLALPVQARRSKPKVERLDLHLPRDEQPMSVERRVLQHLEQAHAPVHYVENSLLNSLFGLLCWPAIFAAVPGAFFHPFQSGPADLLQVDFRQRRAELFDACLEQLQDGRYKQSIRACYQSKWGLQSPFVFWGALNEGLLELALECLPAEHLRHCFERLLEDIKANRTGMPDLIQFWPETGQYRMIEVKGPGDRLQDNQLRWIEFCARHGMPLQVCYVQWQDAVA